MTKLNQQNTSFGRNYWRQEIKNRSIKSITEYREHSHTVHRPPSQILNWRHTYPLWMKKVKNIGEDCTDEIVTPINTTQFIIYKEAITYKKEAKLEKKNKSWVIETAFDKTINSEVLQEIYCTLLDTWIQK